MSFLLRLSSREKSGIKIVGVFHAFTRRTGKLSEHRTFPPSPSFFGFKRAVLGNILRCFARCIGLSRRFVVLNFTNFELLTQVTSINHQMSGGVLASCKGWKLFPVQLIIFWEDEECFGTCHNFTFYGLEFLSHFWGFSSIFISTHGGIFSAAWKSTDRCDNFSGDERMRGKNPKELHRNSIGAVFFSQISILLTNWNLLGIKSYWVNQIEDLSMRWQ